MKHKKPFAVLICVLMLFFKIAAQAQEYFPLPDSNATWIVTDISSQGTFHVEFSLSPFSDDTVINSKVYHKIFLTDIAKLHEYAGAFRSSSDGKTWYVPTGHNPPQEYLWYDLTKNAGDTVRDIALNTMIYSYVGTYDLVVDSVKFKNAGPYNLKCLYLSPIPPWPPHYDLNPIVWAERIGSLNMGIFNGYTCGLNMIALRCMSVDDTIYYFSTSGDCYFPEEINLAYEPGVCDFYVGDNRPEPEDDIICVYPNPVTDHIIVNNIPSGQIDASIYNTYGQMVYFKRFDTIDNNCITLQCNLTPGIYLISLILKNNKLWKQKIIIK